MHTLRAWSATRSKRRPIVTIGSAISGRIDWPRSASTTSALSLASRASTAGSERITLRAGGVAGLLRLGPPARGRRVRAPEALDRLVHHGDPRVRHPAEPLALRSR